MPDVGHGAAARGVAKADALAEAPEGADTTPDESLVAPLEECSVCLNGFERPTMTTCAHWFCRCVQLSSNKPLCCKPPAGLTPALCSVFVFGRISMTNIRISSQHCKLKLPVVCTFRVKEGAC